MHDLTHAHGDKENFLHPEVLLICLKRTRSRFDDARTQRSHANLKVIDEKITQQFINK